MIEPFEDKKIKILKRQLFWLKIEASALLVLTLIHIIYALLGDYVWIIVKK